MSGRGARTMGKLLWVKSLNACQRMRYKARWLPSHNSPIMNASTEPQMTVSISAMVLVFFMVNSSLVNNATNTLKNVMASVTLPHRRRRFQRGGGGGGGGGGAGAGRGAAGGGGD